MPSIKCKICGGQLSAFYKDIFDDRHGYPGRFDIYRCVSCGFGQTVPEIPADQIGDIYTRYYPRKNTINLDDIRKQQVSIMPSMQRWMLGVNNTAHYHVRPGTKVLDVGCGDCTSIREINFIGAEGYGIEPDQNVKELVSALGLKVHIGLFHEMPYEDGFFDYITMSQVLEHIHDPAGLLKDFSRILKNNGQLIIGVPNINSRLRKRFGTRWLNWHVPYHINHFSEVSLRRLASQSGFSVRKIRTYTPNLWVDLQKRLANYPVKEGVRVPFLNGESVPTDRNPAHQLRPSLFKRLVNRIERHTNIVALINILFLRAIDLTGAGESFLLILEKIDKSAKD